MFWAGNKHEFWKQYTHRLWIFDEDLGAAHLVLVVVHVDVIHEVFYAAPHVAAPLRPRLRRQNSVPDRKTQTTVLQFRRARTLQSMWTSVIRICLRDQSHFACVPFYHLLNNFVGGRGQNFVGGETVLRHAIKHFPTFYFFLRSEGCARIMRVGSCLGQRQRHQNSATNASRNQA